MDARLHHLPGLRYFEVAARLNSYSRAAEELFISQAAVSQKIRQLEDGLGCKLFVRDGREMRLTEQGKILFKHVSHGFEHIITGLNQIQSEPIEGLLCVNSTPSFASRWLLPRLWKFSTQHPNIPIRILTSCDAPNLKQGDADLAIWQGEQLDIESNKSFHKEFLFEETIYPFCSPHLAKSINLKKPSQLQACWLIHYESGGYPWESWFAQAGVSMSKNSVRWMEVSTFDHAMKAVMSGHGACLASDSLASDYVERGLLVKPFDIGMTPGIQFNLFYSEDSPRKKRIQAFVNWLQGEISDQQS
ncbi:MULTISPECIES: LysR substrate-binding domain-containing protein [Vibrio]|uniref:LysR substrate-binding domain-containing protein n=1 Tax=Vibrio TaxID=662 RepID=UPI0001B94DF3|nr:MULTISPECIES: LysR substrate-binding domain-containing protein [Vibrio]EEX34210.1 transcriptional regulator [Vibrio coralliilyticus ATCC BAA-450]MCM5509954.1 LysR family transcriptional regulator [Vibrio sp. SCSIO 43169]MDE3900808.1 LysR family transcriptional regulator [Vibrio sp. CC007]NRF62921.1 LysR family transcriptional regulator [Vibrio coralliilyticus]QFT35402.1 Glycine cleavage system transcriptional activator [Vibrio sp. THAF64]